MLAVARGCVSWLFDHSFVTHCRNAWSQCSLRPRHALDVIHFLLIERRPVRPENIVEPDLRLALRALLPGVPGVDRVRLPGDKAPVVCGDLLFLEIGEVRIKCATAGAGH